MKKTDFNRAKYLLLLDELNKQEIQFANRDANMNTRALVLIGSSAVLTATGVANFKSWLEVASVVAVLASVVLGIVALRSSKGAQFGLAGVELRIKCESDLRALEIVYKSRKAAYNADRDYLTVRGKLVNAGFWLLALGIVLSLAALVVLHARQLGL